MMKLGIVTISFNQARFLQEALDSVHVSEPGRLRHVVVDPGSTDGSRELIEQNKERFCKIILEPDRGPSSGLNKGFAACEADIHGYLNSDDRFEPGALDFVLKYFEENPTVDVLMGTCRIIDDHGRSRRRKSLSMNCTPQGFLSQTALCVQQATFFRHRTWAGTHGFNEENRTCWDGELLVDMMLGGACFSFIHKVLGQFRIYPDSISGSGRLEAEYLKENARVLEKIERAGHARPPGWLYRARRLLFHCSPRRRFYELFAR